MARGFDWDRVRTENLERERGIEYFDESEIEGINRPRAKRRTRCPHCAGLFEDLRTHADECTKMHRGPRVRR